MPNSLIIVESPTKIKTIKKYLGSDFNVVASVGHIKDLPKSKLGIDIEHAARAKPHANTAISRLMVVLVP